MAQIKYVNADIIDAYERGEEIVHCVSSDFEMGVGVAKILADMNTDLRPSLRKQHPLCAEHEFRPFMATWCTDDRCIYNLVTKYRYFNKPTLHTLRLAIISLGSSLDIKHKDADIIRISMPKIASGYDKVKWSNTEKLLIELLPDKVIITVYIYNHR